MTYKQAREKIIEAYFRDEIKPMNPNFCFCGTLCNNNSEWHRSTTNGVHNDFGGYLGVEYVKMERALLGKLKVKGYYAMESDNPYVSANDPRYEDRLFEGMAAALEVLRQIHEERGDPTVKEVHELFQKRELIKK